MPESSTRELGRALLVQCRAINRPRVVRGGDEPEQKSRPFIHIIFVLGLARKINISELARSRWEAGKTLAKSCEPKPKSVKWV